MGVSWRTGERVRSRELRAGARIADRQTGYSAPGRWCFLVGHGSGSIGDGTGMGMAVIRLT